MTIKLMTFRQYRGWMWEQEFDQLAKYVKTSSKALRKVADVAVRKRDRLIGKYPDDAEIIDQLWSDEGITLEVDFPALHASATFITIYSVFEHQLVDLCRLLQRKRKLGLAVSDLGGRGIEQCKTYLEKAFGYAFPTNTSEWQEIKNLQRVRNIMTHRRGELDRGGDQDVRQYLARKGTAKLWGDEIHLTAQFCLDAIEAIRAFQQHVIAMIPANLILHPRKRRPKRAKRS